MLGLECVIWLLLFVIPRSYNNVEISQKISVSTSNALNVSADIKSNTQDFCNANGAVHRFLGVVG